MLQSCHGKTFTLNQKFLILSIITFAGKFAVTIKTMNSLSLEYFVLYTCIQYHSYMIIAHTIYDKVPMLYDHCPHYDKAPMLHDHCPHYDKVPCYMIIAHTLLICYIIIVHTMMRHLCYMIIVRTMIRYLCYLIIVQTMIRHLCYMIIVHTMIRHLCMLHDHCPYFVMMLHHHCPHYDKTPMLHDNSLS